MAGIHLWSADDWAAAAERAAQRHGLDPGTFRRQMSTESIGFRKDVIFGKTNSPAGAQGIAQFMPGTAASLGVNPLHPRQALDAAAKLMAGYVKHYGNYTDALVAYNAGPGRVGGALPSETRNYVATILKGHDPGKLGAPQANVPGPRAGSGGSRVSAPQAAGGGAVQPDLGQPSGILATVTQALQAQTRQQGVGASAPALPGFAARPVAAGAGSPQAGVAPVAARQQRLGSAIQSVLAASDTSVPGMVSPAGAKPPAQAGATGGVQGRTLYIGDSLGVGTEPNLKKLLGGHVDANVVGGRSSANGIEALKSMYGKRGYQNIVLDLGTNDMTAGQLAASVRAAQRIAPDARIYIPTLNGPFATRRKNRVLQRLAAADPNVELVPWRSHAQGNLSPDGIHATARGYESRAQLIARTMGVVAPPQQAAGAAPKGFKVGSPVAGQAPHAATHPTDGLAGYPAYDYMAPAGTATLAPVTGTVFKLSGHDPAAGPPDGPHGPFGWSVYIRGEDGRLYYLTHLGSRSVRVGQRVSAGQKIGTIGNYAKWGGADHVHMGVHG